MGINRIKGIFLILALGFLTPSFAQNVVHSAGNNSQVVTADTDSDLLLDALNAYKGQDWNTSVFLFRKLHSNPKYVTPESTYMLIMAEVYSGLYRQAALDCDTFIRTYPSSVYLPQIVYQKGKSLHFTADYEKSILTLSDFCHRYPKNELYSAALFWIGESFYASYNFDNAVPVYSRIVKEFPDSSKLKDAQYRLDVIKQREREEKLLYLLKQTGEDYLSSRENYEKMLRQYKVENTVGANQNDQLRSLREQNESMDELLIKEREKNAQLEQIIRAYEIDQEESVRFLQQQAVEALRLIEMQEGKK
ncbi:MAG: tetratricopeptide repeat protein [Treponema sp.]|nr:tetratricopeptide repeat protein [Treponema sp.]